MKTKKKVLVVSYQEKADLKDAYDLAEALREINYTAELINNVEKSYLDFQQIEYHIDIREEQLNIYRNNGEQAEIKRDQKKLSDLVLKKIEEWE